MGIVRGEPAKRVLMALLVLSFAAMSAATSFNVRPMPETVSGVTLIVRGRAGQGYSDWGVGRDGRRRIYTYTEISVDEVIKGEHRASNVVVREMGGRKDGVGMEVPGSAKFKRGDDVVVFLRDEANPDGSHDIRGMMMGRFEVVRDEEGEERLEGPALDTRSHHGGRQEPDAEGGHADTGPGEDGGPVWTLSRLRELVRSQGTAPAKPDAVDLPKENPSNPAAAPRKRDAAPRLQPEVASGGGSQEEATPSSNRWILTLLALGAAVLGALVWKMTSRS